MKLATERLLRWYDENAREMPWRGIQNPYGTWVSEIMLQQTRVETVRDYYSRFMDRFPTVRDLAEAREEDVLKLWEGLGYYSRARNLQAGARQVMTEFSGVIPKEPEQLRRIRGIGSYTSCSIASIAFGVPVPAVDGNVVRVISRLYHITGNPTEAAVRGEIERLAGELVPEDRAGDHNQAMMDLGATVCVPGTPDCERCPLKEICRAGRNGDAEQLPRLPKARPPKEISWDVLILYSGDRVLMYRREESMLRGLWCFPMLEGWKTEEALRGAIRKKWKTDFPTVEFREEARHVFTHQIWKMKIHTGRTAEHCGAPEGFEWVPAPMIPALALPTAMKAAKRVAMEETRAE